MKRIKSLCCALAVLGLVFTDAAGSFGSAMEVYAEEGRAKTIETGTYVSKLPVIYINTEGSQAITSKEEYLDGELKIQGNDQYNAENTTLYDGTIKIRGRGNSTWANPKKPYKIKLDKKTDLFGFGSNKHWVLLANYTDESHLRNVLSYNFSGEMGMPYMQSVHVDLVLNGEYQGAYQFCEQIKIAKKRVNIHDWEDFAGDVAEAVVSANKTVLTPDDQDAIETQLAETDMGWLTTKKFNYKNSEYDITQYLEMPDATGGFLVELDEYFDEYSKFKSSKNQPIQFKNPEFIATNQTALNYVKDYINAFEQAIDANDYTVDYNGETVTYSQLFDMDSLVQFWLVNELFMNVDAMKKSTYLYKDIDGLFSMGPIWDMDWSSDSLVSAGQGSSSYDTWQTVKYSSGAQADQWYKSIVRDPYFAVRAYEWYMQMKPSMEQMVAEGGAIETYQELLRESANNNYSKWYNEDFSRSKEFAKQVNRLKTYLANRINWMEKQFASPEALAASLGYQAAGGVEVDSAKIKVKDSGVVEIPADVTGGNVVSVEFLVNGKKIGSSNVADGIASMDVPKSELQSADSLNTVQVFGLNAAGEVIISNRKKVTDFAAFETPGDGGDDNKPGEGDGGNKPGEGDGGNKPGEGDGDSKPGEGDGGNKPGEGDGDSKPGEGDGNNKPGGSDTAAVSAVTFEKKAVTVPKGTKATLRVAITAQPGADKTITYVSSDPSVAQVGADGVVTGKKGGTAVITATAGKASDSCKVMVSEVTLNVSSVPMQKKQTTQEIKIQSRYPANDTAKSWNSSKPSVAAVNSKGKITAKKTGTAVITVTMKSGAKASCKIKVIKRKVKTKKLSVAKKSVTLKKGKSFQIVPVRTPVTANDKATYSVNNKKIVRVTSKGKIKALKKGSAKITVKAGGKKVQVKVKVR